MSDHLRLLVALLSEPDDDLGTPLTTPALMRAMYLLGQESEPRGPAPVTAGSGRMP